MVLLQLLLLLESFFLLASSMFKLFWDLLWNELDESIFLLRYVEKLLCSLLGDDCGEFDRLLLRSEWVDLNLNEFLIGLKKLASLLLLCEVFILLLFMFMLWFCVKSHECKRLANITDDVVVTIGVVDNINDGGAIFFTGALLLFCLLLLLAVVFELFELLLII